MGILDKRRERQAEQEAERQRALAAVAADQRRHALELLEWMVNDSRNNFGIDAPGFEEKKGEATFAVLNGVALIEPRRLPGTYQGRSAGYSFRIAKGVNYRIGQSKGTFVQGAEVPTTIDHGSAFVTNQRVVFRGAKATREWAWSKLISLDHDDALPWTSLPVSNRQKTSGLLYDEATTPLIRYRLQQGLVHYQGKVDVLTAELEQRLADLRGGAELDA